MMVNEPAHDWQDLLRQLDIHNNLSEQEIRQSVDLLQRLQSHRPSTRTNQDRSFDQYAESLWKDIASRSST